MLRSTTSERQLIQSLMQWQSVRGLGLRVKTFYEKMY